MGMFGIDKNELKTKIIELCQSDKEFNNKLIEFQSERTRCDALKSELDKKLKEYSKNNAKLETDKLDLEKGKKELAIEKSNISKNYISELNSIFESERAAIDALIQDMNERGNSLSKQLGEIVTLERKVCERERAVSERELEVDAGLPKKNKELQNKLDAYKRELDDKRIALDKEQNELARKRKELNDREEKLNNLQAEANNNFATERETKLQELNKALEDRKESYLKASFDSERLRLKEKEGNLDEDRKALEQVSNDLDGREGKLNERESELQIKESKREEFERSIEAKYKSELTKIDSLRKEREILIKRISSLESLKLNNDEIKAFLGDKTPDEFWALLDKKNNKIAENETKLKSDIEAFETEKQKLKEENTKLNELLGKFTEERVDILKKSRESVEIDAINAKLEIEKNSLTEKVKILESSNNFLNETLSKYLVSYNKKSSYDERVKDIEIPYLSFDKVPKPIYEEIDEIDWLNNINNACSKYGLYFNSRILKSFHTALKTSEWSPLTVLAGVSGTGKSELPRLYSHFGGLMFEPLAVQPNWDSQESMLGFFNSIDNKFDAQPILRFLAQSQKKWIDKDDKNEGYHGFEDAMCIVLLDEMNLAHPELYFAEFLSKLELRRGRSREDPPSLSVKMGAGLEPYKLPLGRNVLWTGTMNQDETTKSLSDKVIDRSIIINFPRPIELKRRNKLSILNDSNRGKLLHRNIWENWIVLKESSFDEETINPFKKFIEEMNEHLAVSGRAIGHRIWQSIEYYMANYPDVRKAQKEQNSGNLEKALYIAFEDQIVQKIMPKLRGIDTRGKSKTDCLDKIRSQLCNGIKGRAFNLTEDFDQACELGYGQFIWQSANYLNSSENTSSTQASTDSNVEEVTLQDNASLETPPEEFRPNDEDRTKYWNAKTKEEKDNWEKEYKKRLNNEIS